MASLLVIALSLLVCLPLSDAFGPSSASLHLGRALPTMRRGINKDLKMSMVGSPVLHLLLPFFHKLSGCTRKIAPSLINLHSESYVDRWWLAGGAEKRKQPVAQEQTAQVCQLLTVQQLMTKKRLAEVYLGMSALNQDLIKPESFIVDGRKNEEGEKIAEKYLNNLLQGVPDVQQQEQKIRPSVESSQL
uniref:Uncharacterized protein n=1 Tax=Hanusia phi TaxID=3032 RepID=A0A7S0HDQ1_9CRYP|mmetsp:Transcript_1730/g.3663  ORF Transcript_1730/g.3663 Transcript_1730/m.3663 type:complete len:189 (+) Transcript_1730:193-759(+)|eukprot:86907-Hanusia_phi.AAC.6